MWGGVVMDIERFRSLVVGKKITDVHCLDDGDAWGIERIVLEDGTELQLWSYAGCVAVLADENVESDQCLPVDKPSLTVV